MIERKDIKPSRNIEQKFPLWKFSSLLPIRLHKLIVYIWSKLITNTNAFQSLGPICIINSVEYPLTYPVWIAELFHGNSAESSTRDST